MRALKRALFFFAIILLATAIFPVNSLVIETQSSSYVYPLGDAWLRIEYNHSVEHSEVIEVIEANSSGMFVRKMLWKDFGAGLPEDIQGREGDYYYKLVDQPLGKSLDYWFIPFNRPKILVDNKTVIKPPVPGLVHFRVERCPLILVIIGRC
ncbi:DUF1850 domain-containing protein [Thermococcus sp.]|uniref:DUF1850 domain-containing protein n=1 Tax=Thermococcus sp. TaxID=35749 RepID=UPI0025FE5C3D|nr:DUF1850 domain-containing protein [Thermococcus sp.]